MKNSLRKALTIGFILIIALVGGTYLSGNAPESMPGAAASTPAPTPESAQTAAAVPTDTPAPTASPAPVPEATATPEPTPTPIPEPERFVLHFVGDCTLAAVPYYVGTQYAYDTVVGTDYAYPFAKTAEIFADDDFTMANLECCLTTSTAAVAKTFTFKAPQAYAQILSEGNVEFVTLANNHILDFGSQGVADTEAALDDVGIAYAGRDEYTVYETERGLRIGIYAVSFGTVDQIRSGIATLKAMKPDFIIAALHWGDEGSYDVNADQIAQGHAAIDAGADFVYGSHPHTLQPVEVYNGHSIYYSMGNWTFGGNTNPRDKDTVILRMTVEKDAEGTVRIADEELIPCACSGTTDVNNYQPVLYEKDSEAYRRTLSKLDGSFTGANLTIGYSYSANE